MNIKVWSVKSKVSNTTYYALLDDFESAPSDVVNIVNNVFIPTEDVLIEEKDINVLLSKLYKKIEKEVKFQLKNNAS